MQMATNEAPVCDEISARWGGKRWQLKSALKVGVATDGDRMRVWAFQRTDYQESPGVEKEKVHSLYLEQDTGRECHAFPEKSPILQTALVPGGRMGASLDRGTRDALGQRREQL